MRLTTPTTLALAALLGAAGAATAANHREAPITALDRTADITDVFAFRSYGPSGPTATPMVTLVMGVDPLLEPANGPNWFPFDPEITYELHVDNDQDALPDVTFTFRFTTEQRLPSVYTVMAGIGQSGAAAPANSPPPVDPGTPLVPPKIESFADSGLGQRQRYSVVMRREQGPPQHLRGPSLEPLYAVPANVGPRTIEYDALFEQGTYELGGGMSVFAGTVDDPFWIDLGAVFDTANFRTLSSGVPGVLTDAEDSAEENFASDMVSGYAVNAIALEIPVAMLTSTGRVEPSTSPDATIGVWATTSRPRVTLRRRVGRLLSVGSARQVQRMGNPLINELIIGTGSKDTFSISEPVDDARFAETFLDPLFPRIVQAIYGGAFDIAAPPRTDLLPLVTYAPPIAAEGTEPGPIADLLRLNTGVAPTAPANASRLGVLGGDPAGFPNGRRLMDDVTDIALRVVVGSVLATDESGESLNRFPNNRLGDGVNVNDAPYRTDFPYLASCPSGRNRRHVDPGEPGGGPVE